MLMVLELPSLPAANLHSLQQSPKKRLIWAAWRSLNVEVHQLGE